MTARTPSLRENTRQSVAAALAADPTLRENPYAYAVGRISGASALPAADLKAVVLGVLSAIDDPPVKADRGGAGLGPVLFALAIAVLAVLGFLSIAQEFQRAACDSVAGTPAACETP